MESLKDLWNQACEIIKKDMTGVSYNVWIAIINPESFDGETLSLSVPAVIQKDTIEKVWIKTIAEAVEAVIGYPCKLEITIRGNDKSYTDMPKAEKMTFDNFIVGSSNRFAQVAAKSVAEHPGLNYNPLFIYGNPGLGKTHLLNAVYNYVLDNHPDFNLLLTTGEQFGNDIINGIRNSNTQLVRDKYRTVDYLLLDDIQFMAGHASTEEEFFNTFNILKQENKQIIVTSDRPPRDIEALEQRIKSRLESGLIANLDPPDYETKVAVINSKANQLGITVSEDVARVIANNIKDNFRQIEGIVKKLFAFKQITGEEPNVFLAQKAISEIKSDESNPITIDKIIEEVARSYNVKVEDIRSRNQSQQVSRARHIAIYVIREITQIPLLTIGREVGGKDHSSVSYALKRVNELLESNSKERAVVNDIIKNLNNL